MYVCMLARWRRVPTVAPLLTLVLSLVVFTWPTTAAIRAHIRSSRNVAVVAANTIRLVGVAAYSRTAAAVARSDLVALILGRAGHSVAQVCTRYVCICVLMWVCLQDWQRVPTVAPLLTLSSHLSCSPGPRSMPRGRNVRQQQRYGCMQQPQQVE